MKIIPIPEKKEALQGFLHIQMELKIVVSHDLPKQEAFGPPLVGV